MKVVFVCDTLNPGGAEKVITTLSNEFVNRSNEVTILMLSYEAASPFYSINDKIELVFLKDALKRNNFLAKRKALKRIIVSKNPDVVISFLSYVCIYTWLALRRTHIPYIVSERNDPNQRGFIKQFLLNKSFKKSSGCVFQTDDALRWYKKIKLKKTAIIHNPVHLSFLPMNVTNRKKQILFVGRLSEQKNIELLLESFLLFLKSNNDYTLKIYGQGPLITYINAFIENNNLKGKILLSENSSSWHKDEYQSSLFVLPSKFEGMPNALSEALCLGIPSVSTNCSIGGPKELKKIFPDTLLLCEDIYSASEFANCMRDALKIVPQKPFVPDELLPDFIAEKWLSFIKRCI